MNRIILVGLALALGFTVSAGTASAGPISAVASYTSTADGPNFDYTITLTNTSSGAGADTVGTFWFAWIPGQDYMSVMPTNIISPNGWQSLVTHSTTSPDGFAIQWKASTAAGDLAPGGKLSFSFTSSETPAQMAGNSPFFPSTPTGTSFVYNGAPLTGDSAQFVVTPAAAAVPEPSTLMLAGAGGLGLLVYNRVRRRRGV